MKDDREGASKPFVEAVQKLRFLAKAIEDSLVPGSIRVLVESGHRVNLGQQYSFVVDVPQAGLRDVLLRAYVPPDGYPVTLDLFEDERPVCGSLTELETAILRFLGNRDVKQRLLEVKDLVKAA
jgi:hypothetical protein